MLLRTVSIRRSGISLLEVIVATAIFLMALVGLRQLVSVAGEQALEVEMRSQATRMCQSKMAELQSGILPLSSASDTFDEDPDYTWSLDVQPGTVSNLWVATMKVTRQRSDSPDNPLEVSLTQMLLDPSVAGSTSDAAAITGTDTSTGTTTSSGGNAPTTGAAAPATGGAAPATGGTAPRTGGAAPATGGTAPRAAPAAPANTGSAPRTAPGGR